MNVLQLYKYLLTPVLLKILHNLVAMQKFLLANSCWRKQTVQDVLIFIFNELSENLDSFV